MLRESGSGEDISEVIGGILWKKRILLTARNTSSLVIDSLCNQAKKEYIAVAVFYCDFISQQEQSITNIVGAILRQLVAKGGIPDYLRQAFQEARKEIGGRGLRLAELMAMLRVAIASLPQVFICVDALDECLPKCLPELLGSLRDIVRESPTTRIFLTGRPHVTEDIQRYFMMVVVIPISPNTDDIRNYVEMRLDRDSEPEAMSNGLRADIVRVILEKISDMCVRPFSISPYQLCVLTGDCGQIPPCFAQYRRHPRRGDNSSEKKET